MALHHLLLIAALGLSAVSSAPAPLPTHTTPVGDDAYDQRLKEAGNDTEKLWDLYVWCTSTERSREASSVLRKIVRVDPEHVEAREKLGHVRFDRQWFTSEKKLATYKKKKEEQEAKDKGWVKTKFGWVDPADLAFLERGLVRHEETGEWMTPDDLKKMQSGWVRQDLTWVSPEDLEKIDAGLWKVGDEWMELDRANDHHSRIGNWWIIPADGLVLYTTTTRETATKAIGDMDRGMRDLRRIFGAKPKQPLRVALLRSQEQYDRFATGDTNREHPATNLNDRFVMNRACLAESWFRQDGRDYEYLGMGAGYWDSERENGDKFGVHAARLAIGFSYVEAMDPSPEAVGKVLDKGPYSDFLDDFFEEKRLPEWLRTGAAVYAERFYRDTTIKTGGDPWWTRKWSIDAIKSGGGLSSLSEIFRFRLDPGDPNHAKHLMTQAGLLVAFIVDGGCEPVLKAHAKFREACENGKLERKHADALVEAIENHESELRAFAGL